MAGTPKQSKQRQSVLTEHDLERLAHFRRNPKQFDEILRKLRSRKKRGTALQAEREAIIKLEAFSKYVEREQVGQSGKQGRKVTKRSGSRRTTDAKQELERAFEELGRGRARAAKSRSARATSTLGVRRVVSGGAPGLGRRG